MIKRFIGVATPRSGTAWLANFLTYGQASYCRHESLWGCGSLKGYTDSIDRLETPVRGSVETAAALIAEPLLTALGDTYKFFVLVRDPDDVAKSLESIGCSTGSMPATLNNIHWLMGNHPGTPLIRYENLFTHATLLSLWRYLEIDAPFPIERLEMLREILVEDGRIKGFGRFSTDEGCEFAGNSFKTMYNELHRPVFGVSGPHPEQRAIN